MPNDPSHTRAQGAFTLLELLVVIGIIAILSALAYGVGQTAINRARLVREVAAAKSLITAFTSTPADNDGHYLLGYDSTGPAVTSPGGHVYSGEPANRYPFRLAPYFEWNLDDTILVNSNTKQVGGDTSGYQISLNPALGMNIFLAGGELRDTAKGVEWAGECMRMPSMNTAPIVVFASAGYDNGGTRVNGYFKVTPPRLGGPIWSTKTWSSSSKPADYGQVDARYNGQAVCAFSDGSVRALSVEDLRDMRLWSQNAAIQNNPNYTPVNQSAGDAGL